LTYTYLIISFLDGGSKLIDEVVMTAAARRCSQRNAFPSSPYPPENLVHHPSKSKCVLKGIEGIEKQCSDSQLLPCLCGLRLHTQSRRGIRLPGRRLRSLSSCLRLRWRHLPLHYAPISQKPGSITPKALGKKQWPGKDRRQDSSPSFHRRRNAGHGEEVKFRETVSRISRQQPVGKGEEKITALLMLFLTWRRPPRAAL